MKEVFIELLNGRFSVRADKIVAFMICDHNPTAVKVEYYPNSSLTVNHKTEEDAKEFYENLKKYMNNLKQ